MVRRFYKIPADKETPDKWISAEENNGESQGPVLALGRGHERGRQLAMKPFDHAVGLRVVAGSPVATDAEKGHEFVPHVGRRGLR